MPRPVCVHSTYFRQPTPPPSQQMHEANRNDESHYPGEDEREPDESDHHMAIAPPHLTPSLLQFWVFLLAPHHLLDSAQRTAWTTAYIHVEWNALDRRKPPQEVALLRAVPNVEGYVAPRPRDHTCEPNELLYRARHAHHSPPVFSTCRRPDERQALFIYNDSDELGMTLFCHVGSEVGKNQWSRINALWSKRWLPISTQTVLAASIQSKPFPNMTEEGSGSLVMNRAMWHAVCRSLPGRRIEPGGGLCGRKIPCER